MGVGVALQAIIQSEMGGVFVAATTRRDNVFVPWGVADMAVLASELVTMGHAVVLNGGDYCRVALDAIIERKFVLGSGGFGDGLIGGEALTQQES